jgi:NAD(P)-dependent dehydrogenase (short-subunit alcohol dehydrogenase family)
MTMLLQDKNAVIYGAGGSLGGAVAKALAASGAKLFLTGRNEETVQGVANEIRSAGGYAVVNKLDALNENEIRTHLEKVLVQAGSVDISFNATGCEVVQNLPMIDMTKDDFMGPVTFMLQTQFLTATAAGRIMMKQRSGIVLTLTATPGGIGYPLTAGFAPACCAVESLSRNLAAELGRYGVRVVNIRSAGSPDSRLFANAIEKYPDVMEPVLQRMKQDTMLKALPLMSDIANVSVFLASPWAGKITGVTVDVTCGTTAGLNYRSDLNAF